MPTAIPEHEHFAAAARRHRDDALHLHTQNRLPNADHLLGLGVECAIKSVLLELGIAQIQSLDKLPYYQVNPNTKPDKLSHLPPLATTASQAVSGRGSTRFVAAMSQIDVDYGQWDVADRYLDGLDVTPSVFASRKAAADDVFAVAQDSRLAGTLL